MPAWHHLGVMAFVTMLANQITGRALASNGQATDGSQLGVAVARIRSRSIGRSVTPGPRGWVRRW